MKRNKRFVLFCILAATVCANALAQKHLRTGDLLFNISDTTSATDFAKSITASTNGLSQLQVEHVAIVCQEDSGTYVLEATSKHGVWMTRLSDYLANADHTKDGKPMVLVGRISRKADIDIPTSIRRAKSFIGRKYDFLFSPTDDEFYCSELVQKSFVTHKGALIFSPIPMSFHDQDGQILPYWIDYYAKRNLDVPEGEPGSNPGQLSRDPRVHIFPAFSF